MNGEFAVQATCKRSTVGMLRRAPIGVAELIILTVVLSHYWRVALTVSVMIRTNEDRSTIRSAGQVHWLLQEAGNEVAGQSSDIQLIMLFPLRRHILLDSHHVQY